MNMKLLVIVVVGITLLLMSAAVQSFDPHGGQGLASAPLFDVRMQGCFSRAMIGMDSVINSRVGVPAEHALALSVQDVTNSTREAVFDEPLLKMILSAYLWEESPHSYAIKVFYECAASAPRVAGRSDFLP